MDTHDTIKAGEGELALSLGGGGLPGLAWTIGLLHGWADHGFGPAAVDHTLGTSAGAAAAALWHHPEGIGKAFARQVGESAPPVEVSPEAGALFGAAVAAAAEHPVGSAGHLDAYLDVAGGVTDDAGRRHASLLDRLDGATWPGARLTVTALSTSTRGRRLLTVDDGFDLADVVAASCAVPGVWPAVALGDDVLVDAGPLSDAHADVLAAFSRVVVVEPVPNIGGRYRDEETAVLERAVVVRPDEESLAAMGGDAFALDTRAAAARAGLAQAGRERSRIEAVL